MATTCYGQSAGVFHIAPGGGFFADGGMCLNSPVDASEYPSNDRLYVYANINYSNPNIRTIFPDGSDDVYYTSSGYDYMWIYWDWNGWIGDVKFELRDGTSVKATRYTHIKGDEPNISGEIIEVGELVKLTETASHDYGYDAVVKNTGTAAAYFAIILAGATKNTSVRTLQPGEQYTIYCLFDDPRYNKCLDFELIVNRSIVCDTVSACWDIQPSPCDGVECPDTCVLGDMYSFKCLTDGVNYGCDFDQLLEENSPDCPGYVPPCPTPAFAYTIVGIDWLSVTIDITVCNPGEGALWSSMSIPSLSGEDDNAISNVQVGRYVYTFSAPGTYNLTLIGGNDCGNASIASHSVTVTSDPCIGVECHPECFYPSDMYETVCYNGICVRGALIEENSADCGYVPPDPCEGVVCSPECIGSDLYKTVCDEGVCVKDELIEANNEEICGYVPPTPDPDENIIDILIDNKELVILGTVAGIIVIKSI